MKAAGTAGPRSARVRRRYRPGRSGRAAIRRARPYEGVARDSGMMCHSLMARTPVPGRREAILDAAHSVFARKGYVAAGVADLAAELGIGHGTVYRYFDNKRDVAVAVLDRALSRIAAVVAAESPWATSTLPEYRAQVERIGHRLYELFAADPAMGRLVFVDL